MPGWVVGPLPDRSIFDKELPTTWDAITSIDLNTGHAPVDPSYVNVTRHRKWVSNCHPLRCTCVRG